jgi:hypothetical protein
MCLVYRPTGAADAALPLCQRPGRACACTDGDAEKQLLSSHFHGSGCDICMKYLPGS